MTRDSIFWGFSMIGAVALGLTSHYELFPWIPEHWRNVIEFVAFIYGIIAGKMATSPLPGKADERS